MNGRPENTSETNPENTSETKNDRRVNFGPDGSLFVKAPAKINLFLHITGRRDDGYHLLESLFSFTKKGDLIRILPSETLNFSVFGPFSGALAAENADNNLVVKAAKALMEHTGTGQGASIELEKNLPVASGLGGGSADAAAALIGLNALWKTKLNNKELADIAVGLGADVPACLNVGSQIVRGIGEKREKIDLPWSAGIVIINPGKAVSTPEVFAGFRAFRDQHQLPPFDVAITDLDKVVADVAMLGVLTSNSLQDPAVQVCPEIIAVERFLRLETQNELVRMSGSGASVFALYHDKAAAESVARRARDHNPDWWVMADLIGE